MNKPTATLKPINQVPKPPKLRAGDYIATLSLVAFGIGLISFIIRVWFEMSNGCGSMFDVSGRCPEKLFNIFFILNYVMLFIAGVLGFIGMFVSTKKTLVVTMTILSTAILLLSIMLFFVGG